MKPKPKVRKRGPRLSPLLLHPEIDSILRALAGDSLSLPEVVRQYSGTSGGAVFTPAQLAGLRDQHVRPALKQLALAPASTGVPATAPVTAEQVVSRSARSRAEQVYDESMSVLADIKSGKLKPGAADPLTRLLGGALQAAGLIGHMTGELGSREQPGNLTQIHTAIIMPKLPGVAGSGRAG